MSDPFYKELLRQHRHEENGTDGRPKKRRKRAVAALEPEESQLSRNKAPESDVIVISDKEPSQEASDSWDSDEFEDVDVEDENSAQQQQSRDIDNEAGGTEEEDDNEPVYNFNFEEEPTESAQDSITVTLKPETEEEKSRPKRKKFTPIAKEERDKRVLMHKIYLVLMVCHGVIRNRWCNDYQLLVSLRRLVSPQIMSRLDQDNADVLDNVKSRRFLDGLQMILKMYSKRFRVKSKGLIRKNWNELSIKQDNVDNNITFNRFKRLVCNFTGSRDLGAQGFVALLRSIGLNCRLVFSLQPPDYTSVASFPAIESSTPPPEPKKESPPSSKDSLLERLRKANTNNSKANMLLKMRSNVAHDSPSKTNNQKNQKYTFPDSDYPVFWCEVWNKYNSKWVSIDPVVKGIIEQPPMRRKSSFEPPYTDPTNQATYVLAYDKLGGIKDVTRRYSQYFNARTVKKRIGFRSDEDQFWYTQLLRYSNSSLRRDNINKIDVFESKEFYNRDLSEGMPNSLNDFKNHPIYAIESQLRQNEIIYPKDDTSKCGTFRNKGRGSKKGEVIPVYKRSHVYLLRSAKAWYMRGRVLKIGVQPFKTRRKAGSIQLGDDDDEEDIVRLYAEFQTQLYIPPPIVDGQIPKNAYKNIDIYTPTMIPENGAIIETTGKYTMRMAERAAKYILEIDYAKAIIAFDFGSKGGGKNRKGNRMPTAREGGILIDKQFEEAMYLVLDCLVEEEETRQREDVELNSLRNWKYFLTKLRITERLNRQHGKVDAEETNSENKNVDIDSDKETTDDEEFSVHDESSDDDFEQGGFFLDQEAAAKEPVPHIDMEDEIPEEGGEISEEGGFIPEEGGFIPEEGGFIPEEGGFIPEEGGFIPEEGRTPEEDGEGGFVVDSNHRSKGTNEDTEDLSFLQTIPDTHFKEDENGELVYDPREDEETPEILDEASNEEISSKDGKSPISATEEPKGIPEEKPEEHQTEVTDEQSKPKADAWLHDAPLPNAPDTQDQSPDEVTNSPNEPLPEPLPQPSAQPSSHESSGELPNEFPGEQSPDEEELDEQEQLDPEELAKIAQEENELGFEYSDSD